jgi:hypothetical protein
MIQGYRRTDGGTQTPGGQPLPLTGKPLTETPVVVKPEGVPLKEYPEACIPAQEELGENEMRLICIGSGNPPVRRAQANLLHWTPPGPKEEGPPQLDPKSPGTTEQFVVDTILPPEA